MKDIIVIMGYALAFCSIAIIGLVCTLYKERKELKTYKNQKAYMDSLIAECKAFIANCKSNITAIPYMAGIVAEIETRGYSEMAQCLNWGEDKRRLKKVASLLDVKRDAKSKIEQAKQAEYQLKYLLALYPAAEELLDADFSEIPKVTMEKLAEKDCARDYLSKEEWQNLSPSEKNQLALERYIESHRRTKWQIGRDYEEFIAHEYRKMGFSVDHFGGYMGLEDLGRDIIARKENEVHIVQCKYWSQQKTIHEKHINQLFGTMTSYAIEHKGKNVSVKGVFVTNIALSEMARLFANRLQIEVRENVEMGDYPMIKCNIGRSGEKIYHLPFDQQYDSVKVDKDGEFYAKTVEQAETAGFRRAFKWHGN